MPLDLLVPRLVMPDDAAAPMGGLRLPSLEKWVARADVTRTPARTASAWLAERFALASPPPIAAISLVADVGTRDGNWMRADPVHLRIDGDGAQLHDAAVLQITSEEAEALVEALRSHFAGDGLGFEMARADRWYVRVAPGEMPTTTSLEDAIGRDVFALLPHSGGNVNWRSALTEAQMVLGAHAANVRRESEGKPAVNSIWFWGEGVLPAKVEQPFSRVYADDPFARGLAILSGAPAERTPDSLADVDSPAEERVLVVLDALAAPWRRGDAAGWAESARALDATWFSQLGAAIKRFGEVRLVLPSDLGTRVARLDSASRWRWFRNVRPVSHA